MDLCAAGVIDLGLTPAQFWDLTPREIDSLSRRLVSREERWDRRFGMLACLYAESHRDKDKRAEPFTVEDFIPRNTPQRATAQAAPADFLQPCAECGVPRWQGHLPHCLIGSAQFNRQAHGLKAKHDAMISQAGRKKRK